MPDRSNTTTTGHDPGPERTLSEIDFTGKGQYRKRRPHSDHSAKANTAFVVKCPDGGQKHNFKCPVCKSMVRYQVLRPGSGNLKAECENPDCTWTIDFLRKDKEPQSNEIRLKQWQKFGRRC